MSEINTEPLAKLIAYKRQQLDEAKMPEAVKRMLQREIDILVSTFEVMRTEIIKLELVNKDLGKQITLEKKKSDFYIEQLKTDNKPISFSKALEKDELLKGVPISVISRIMAYAQ